MCRKDVKSKRQNYCAYTRLHDDSSLFSFDDQKIVDAFPELERLVLFLNQLKAIEPCRRGSLVLRVMDVLELTRRRFLRRLSEVEQDGNR